MVSVIIPVRNAANSIEEFMVALLNQTYPKEKVEILFIDNGSSDQTVAIIQQFPVKLVTGVSAKNPYLARNKGIEMANGDIIALIDANKIPDKNWIKKGIESLILEKADLVGGNIKFEIFADSGPAEIYDSLTFNNNRKFVKEENGSAAGNLFFKKEILNTTGDFPGHFRSGMDIWWTREAVKKGFKLVYSEKAIVYCKPRGFSGILKKSYRVGKTHPFNQTQNGVSLSAIIWITLRTFAPPGVSYFKEGVEKMNAHIAVWKVWLVAWFSKIFMGLGRIHGLIHLIALKRTSLKI